MEKINEIIDGWKNVLSGVTTQQATERSKVCAECPQAVKTIWWQKIIGYDDLLQVNGYKCNECGCPLSAKVRSEKSDCPLGKWEKLTDK